MTAEPINPSTGAAVGAEVAPGYQGPADAEPSAPRSLARQAVIDTFGRWGARAGIVWLAVVLFAGVFAPFLANSHPILLRAEGHWSSPLLRNLTPTDVLLLAVTFFAIGLAVTRRFPFTQLVWATVWIAAVAAPVICWPSFPYPKILAQAMVRSAGVGPLLMLAGLVAAMWAAAVLLRRTKLGLRAAIVAILAGFFALFGAAGFGRMIEQVWALLIGLFLAAHVAAVVLIPALLRISTRARVTIGSVAVAMVIFFVAVPIRPPSVVSYSRYREDLSIGLIEKSITTFIPYSPGDRMRDAATPQQNQPPGRAHWFGTTPFAEDVLSRMIYASRIAISIGFISTGIAVIIGCTIGGLMGYFVGKVDIIGMRLIEVFEAIPTLFLLITFVAFYGRNLYIMMAIIGLTGWTGDARFIRAEFLRLRKQDFVQAALAAGLPLRSILFRHMLPNGIAPVLVSASFGVASAILAEATLSFLGLGLIDEPSWGQMLNQARGVGTSFLWWMAIFPGGAIFLTMFAYNLLGEAVRDAIDPKLRKRD